MLDESSSPLAHQDAKRIGDRVSSGAQNLSENDNPYVAPGLSSGAGGPAVEHDLTEELTAVVGLRKAAYYLEKWNTILSGGRGGWNWAAFFLSGLWLPYRKMYKYAFIYWGIVILESTLEEVYFVGIVGMPEPPGAISSIVGFLASSICGSFGNGWYLAHAKKVIGGVREERLSREPHLQRLSELGGTNLLGAFGIVILAIVAASGVLFAIDLTLFPSLIPME